MKLDSARPCLAVAVAAAFAAAMTGCAAAEPARAPRSEVSATTLTSAVASGPKVLTGKVQRAGSNEADATDGATDATDGDADDAPLVAATKDSTKGGRPSDCDRRDASRRGGFGSGWK